MLKLNYTTKEFNDIILYNVIELFIEINLSKTKLNIKLFYILQYPTILYSSGIL